MTRYMSMLAKAKIGAVTSRAQRLISRRVRARQPTHAERDEFQQILNDSVDEGPIQTFLAEHASFLIRLLPPGAKVLVYDRPKLGSEYIPDFLISVTNSQGSQWTCIELESPTRKPLTKVGQMSAKLAHGIAQINDWRDWLRDNIAYARGELDLKGISGDLAACIIIGRRAAMNNHQQKRYAALNRMGFTVLSYDRLLDI